MSLPRPSLPLLSVVVAVRNDGRELTECLQCIQTNDYPGDLLEVLVVDGCSTDDTVARAMAFQDRLPIRILTNPGGQRAAGLNLGILASRGEIVVRLDARSRCGPAYFRELLATLETTGAANVGGVMRPTGRRPTQIAVGAAMQHPFGVGNARFRRGGSGTVDTVYLGCFRRTIFSKVGLFDANAPIISEDSEMNLRIRMAGEKVYLNDRIQVEYAPREDLRGLARLYFRYGGARAGVIQKHRRLTSPRQLAPPLLLLGLTGGVLAGLFVIRWALWLSLMALCTYLAADVAAATHIVYRRGRLDLWPRLLAAFPLMHFPYAAGMLTRLVQPVLRRDPPGYYWGN